MAAAWFTCTQCGWLASACTRRAGALGAPQRASGLAVRCHPCSLGCAAGRSCGSRRKGAWNSRPASFSRRRSRQLPANPLRRPFDPSGTHSLTSRGFRRRSHCCAKRLHGRSRAETGYCRRIPAFWGRARPLADCGATAATGRCSGQTPTRCQPQSGQGPGDASDGRRTPPGAGRSFCA